MSTLLNLKEVQERLGISESTMFRLIKAKELKGFKVGRVWKFEEEDIANYIKQQREKAEGKENVADSEEEKKDAA